MVAMADVFARRNSDVKFHIPQALACERKKVSYNGRITVLTQSFDDARYSAHLRFASLVTSTRHLVSRAFMQYPN